MPNRLPARDLEQLSAYMDGQLDLRRRTELEARMKTDPILAAALGELRTTQAILRRAPQRRAPRNFTLSPAMLGAKTQTISAWNNLRLVSAVATILLVVVFAGDLWANNQLGLAASATSVAEEAPQTLMMPEPAMKESETTTPEFAGDAAGEAQPFALEIERVAQEQPAPFDLRVFILDYARLLELGLMAIAAAAALLAWRRRHNKA
ncbi:MAG: hypothetical protein WD751_01475 [Anaerolineales bacterium]